MIESNHDPLIRCFIYITYNLWCQELFSSVLSFLSLIFICSLYSVRAHLSRVQASSIALHDHDLIAALYSYLFSQYYTFQKKIPPTEEY